MKWNIGLCFFFISILVYLEYMILIENVEVLKIFNSVFLKRFYCFNFKIGLVESYYFLKVCIREDLYISICMFF